MREMIGAFEIGVMPAPETAERSAEKEENGEDSWQLLAALLFQVFACFGQAH
jgi:hypothetical protein